MSIPLVDLRAQYHYLAPEIDRVTKSIMQRGAFIMGPELEAFEEAFAAHTESAYAVGVGSGTDAIQMALRAAGIGPGDEVITVANTFIATLIGIELAGARPRLVDCDPETLTMNPDQLRRALTHRTRALMPVHLYGRPAPMDSIAFFAEDHGLDVIEDACQAHGARWRDRRVGGIGRAAAFSFYPGKNLGAYGDGGAVVTSDEQLARNVRLLRDFGQTRKYHHDVFGFNSRLDNLQAGILSVKLAYLDEWNRRRRALAARYTEALAGLPLVTPAPLTEGDHVYHLYPIRVARRDEVLESLRRQGVGAGIHYPVPAHLHGSMRHLGYVRGDFPVAEALAQDVLSLPLYPEMTEAQQDRVVAALVTALEELGVD